MEARKKQALISELLLKFSDPASHPTVTQYLNDLFDSLPDSIGDLFIQRDGASKLPLKLKELFEINTINNYDNQHIWEKVGLWYKDFEGRYFEALQIFLSLYHYMCEYQVLHNQRITKGMPLVWISECFKVLNFNIYSMKYLMLTLIEDAISGQGIVSPNPTGSYFRLVWLKGMPDKTLTKYAEDIYRYFHENEEYGKFPEWILMNIGNGWISEIPSQYEAYAFYVNPIYIKFLLSKTRDGTGKALEQIASYLLSYMPGVITKTRVLTHSTDFDVLCNMDGFQIDFRSEFGRYFICECKDLSEPVNFTAFAKFCRILDSIKSKFGIIFTLTNISGAGTTEYAEREQVKVFQDRGIVIIVVDESDINSLVDGNNFINILRNKYEKIRLDLK